MLTNDVKITDNEIVLYLLGRKKQYNFSYLVNEYISVANEFCYRSDFGYHYDLDINDPRQHHLYFYDFGNDEFLGFFGGAIHNILSKIVHVIADPWCWMPTEQQLLLLFVKHWHKHNLN